MAYIFKVVLRRENKEFYYIQNRINSASSFIAVCNRGDNLHMDNLYNIRNKDGHVKVQSAELEKSFKAETITKLKHIITSMY